MTSESSHSHGGAGESHTTLETNRSFPQNTPSAHLNDMTRSITPSLSLSLTGQRAPANQQDSAAPERPSRPTTLLRESSLRSFPPDDTDANIGQAQRNDGAAIDPQFHNLGVNDPPTRRASLNLKVRPPTPVGSLKPITERYIFIALQGLAHDPDEWLNPIEQEDPGPDFDVPRSKNNELVKFNTVAAMFTGRKANKHEYSPLERSETVQIRILRIEPAPSDAIVICSLIPSTLSEPYEAVIYLGQRPTN
jgi:hypothetical protein